MVRVYEISEQVFSGLYSRPSVVWGLVNRLIGA